MMLSIIKKDKEQTLYPNPNQVPMVSDEWASMIFTALVSFFKKKDARNENGLEKMFAKELAKQEKKKSSDKETKKIETIADLYTEGKVIIVFYQKNFDSHKKEIHLAKDDFNYLKECIEIGDALFFSIQGQKNWLKIICDKWGFSDFYDSESNKITFYGGMKYYCNNYNKRFVNKTFEFLQISTELFVEMRKKYVQFKNKLAAAVWKNKLGTDINLPMYDEVDIDAGKNIGSEEIGTDEFGLTLLKKLKQDVKKAAIYLTDEQARYLVDTYYQMQRYRITANNQCRILDTVPENEPHEMLTLFSENFATIERNIKSCLEVYAASKPIGKWMLSICGIGPVITAGIMANIDISKVETAGSIQRFAGLDPTLPPNKKGEKRKYNSRLKVLCWKIGESFLKTCNRDDDFYGKYFKIRKDYETKKDANGDYAEQAMKIPTEKTFIKKDVEKTYLSGHLPKGHILSRSKRYAVKLFLSHLFTVWYELDRGLEPPKPFEIAILKHTHYIKVPNWDAPVKTLIKEFKLDELIDNNKEEEE